MRSLSTPVTIEFQKPDQRVRHVPSQSAWGTRNISWIFIDPHGEKNPLFIITERFATKYNVTGEKIKREVIITHQINNKNKSKKIMNKEGH